MPVIKFEGIEELQKHIAKNVNIEKVKEVVKSNGADLQDKAQVKAEFKGHYKGNEFIIPSGKLKGSIELDIKNGGLESEVEPKADYAAYVELGTRFMDAQPYLKPAFDEQLKQFKKDMKDLVK